MPIPALRGGVSGCCGSNGQIHTDYRVLWRKRDSSAALRKGTAPLLSQEESASAFALTSFYCFSGYITLRMILLYCAQVCFRWLQKTKERVLLIT